MSATERTNEVGDDKKYTRTTELRHLEDRDTYELSWRLDQYNSWERLMEIVPKNINAQECSADGALHWDPKVKTKYETKHIEIIRNAAERNGNRSASEIFLDEWSTSGRREERPTIGLLLQLLIKRDIWHVADFVATEFLKEPQPARPLVGPARRFSIPDLYSDVVIPAHDSTYYPGTHSLNMNLNGITNLDKNKDYFLKVKPGDGGGLGIGKLCMPNNDVQYIAHRMEQASTTEADSNPAGNSNIEYNDTLSTPIPKFSSLIQSDTYTNSSSNPTANAESRNTESTNLSEAPIPNLDFLLSSRDQNSAITRNYFTGDQASHYLSGDEPQLPDVLEDLILNGENEHDNTTNTNYNGDGVTISTERNLNDTSPTTSSSLSNDDDDDDYNGAARGDSLMPNSRQSERRSSNNDSSLTNVTGTSGENSFENSSSVEDNIPCLSAFQQ